MWQQWSVGVIVAFCAAYMLWYWMPAGWRKPLARINKNLAEAPGCGACSSCGGCAAKGPASPGVTGTEGRQPVWMPPRP
jgi:hypothetical protein